MTLSERVAKDQKLKNEGKARTAKTEFIAQKNDIKEALDSGWTMKAVWETLYKEDKISCRYNAFRNHVINLIKSEEEKTTRAGDQEKETPKSKIKGFSFNPIPNLEELV
tara:strand:+ start:1873 stop:2199 length:327 start_codon:yes stop_codon:yes gene_type:complete